ncbi:hypothetical protein NECAME_07774 [Necator americanus]|uniref:G-protein coupled receptors family 1 profile domain-containing protein n=1 Tax=Necator americanus TaxID=51031 RepID=W2TMA8_NECAM|nr:hypothetical protein NECAME_07774 [Necator americanus]ETN82769.1 hypothetical protein NECAME_07774 [Necator americanus]
MGISVSLLVLVSLITIAFNCAGLFGNFNIIIALIRKPALRSKAGYLMGLLCCFQSFCLLFELSNIRIYWSEMIMGKGVCFRVVYPHLFCMVAQSLMYFIITLDMLIAISAPLRHKMWPKVPYVIVMCAPPTMFASTAWIGSYFYIGEGSFYSCRLLTASIISVGAAADVPPSSLSGRCFFWPVISLTMLNLSHCFHDSDCYDTSKL